MNPLNSRTCRSRAFVSVLLLVCTASSASAQNYSFDARRIALGGVGGTPNLASKLVEQQRRYQSIVIPLGLVKVLTNLRVFYPNREDFDFSRAVEFAYSPFHQVFGRGEDITGRTFFRDIIHAQLEPDLNAYRGFDIDPSVTAEGLILENWGKTFMVHKDERSFQGIYVGAGPYLAARALRGVRHRACGSREQPGRYVLSGRQPGHRRRGNRPTGPRDYRRVSGTLSVLLSGGDCCRPQWHVRRREFPLPAGFRLDEFNANVHFETDAFGLVSPNPPTAPFALDWHTSSHGRGMAIDAGVAFVVNRWDFGAGVGGIANRITWTQIRPHHLTLVSLFGGTEFVHVKLPVTSEERRYELPVTYTGDVAYHREQWSVLSEVSHGFMGDQIRAGLEYRLGSIELRGAGRYSDGLVSLSRSRLQPDPQLWRRRSRLRHTDVPRAKPPRWDGHFVSLRQEVGLGGYDGGNGFTRSNGVNRDERRCAADAAEGGLVAQRGRAQAATGAQSGLCPASLHDQHGLALRPSSAAHLNARSPGSLRSSPLSFVAPCVNSVRSEPSRISLGTPRRRHFAAVLAHDHDEIEEREQGRHWPPD